MLFSCRLPAIILAFSGLIGCSKEQDSLPSPSAHSEMAAPAAPAAAAQGNSREAYAPKLIRTATLHVRVDDIDAFTNNAILLVKKEKGYVESQSIRNFGNRVSASLILRVPANLLDVFLESLSAGAAFVESRTIGAEDVTAQYVDTTARLHAKRELESQYLVLLKRASSVKDMVAIQEQLGRVREEIEGTEASLKVLTNRIDLASIEVTAYKELESGFLMNGNFFTAVSRSFRDGISIFISFIIFLVRIWPFVIGATLVLILFLRKRARSSRLHRPVPTSG